MVQRMTTKDSICVRCENLKAFTNALTRHDDGSISLISECCYGGKNAGNRKTCKNFVEADKNTIERRLEVLEGVLF